MVVIDLLRASTTVCHALAAGAREVVPFQEVDAVLAAAQGCLRSEVLLGGERGGKIIPGFDLGNSPCEYTPEVVFGKRVLFTTTNGTRAIHHARLAARVVMGCVANLAALADSLADEPVVHLLCAGTGGHVAREDQLAAGAIAATFCSDREYELNEAARSVLGEWQELVNTAAALGRLTSEQLAVELRTTTGGKNLLAIGQDDDLVVCAEIDSRAVVPELDRAAGCLKLSAG